MEINELRRIYKELSTKSKDFMGAEYTAQDFNKDVGAFLDSNELDKTPENWVIGAEELLKDFIIREWHAAEFAHNN